MKKLSNEEKAKRFDEIIKKVSDYFEGKAKLYSDVDKTLNYLLPELKESEDERIRNFISNELACLRATEGKGSDRYEELTNALAWLEKQGEKGTNGNNEETPNSAWSEEDEKKFRDVIRLIEQGAPVQSMRDHYTTWLKSLKDRVQPQPKKEWSEEDEKLFGLLHTCVCRCITDPYWDYEKRENVSKNIIPFLDKLKTLIPQTAWKPSEKQMDALYTYIYNPQYFSSPDPRMELVESVYQELKKLKG